MKLGDDTSRTLAVLSVILLALGLLVGAPAGKLLLFALALLPALPVALFGGKRGTRILAAASLAAAALLAVATYGSFRSHMDAYRARAKRAAAPASPAAPPAGGDSLPPSPPSPGR